MNISFGILSGPVRSFCVYFFDGIVDFFFIDGWGGDGSVFSRDISVSLTVCLKWFVHFSYSWVPSLGKVARNNPLCNLLFPVGP